MRAAPLKQNGFLSCRKPSVRPRGPESVKYHVALSSLSSHLRSHLKYEHHPEVIQVIRVPLECSCDGT